MDVEEIVSSDASLDTPRKQKDRRYHKAHRAERNQKSKAYYAANKDRLNQMKKGYYQAHKEEANETSREYRQAHKAELALYEKERRNKEERRKEAREYHKANRERLNQYRKAHHYSSKYGLTISERVSMEEAQGGLCAICGQKETKLDATGKKIRALSIDHNHATGQVRGLLCNDCNLGISKFKDNPNFLLSAYRYVVRFSEQATLAE